MLFAALCIAIIVAFWCALGKVADWIIRSFEIDDEDRE